MYITESYNSLNELLKTLESRKTNNKGMEGRKSSVSGDEDFTGTKNYKQAVDYLKNGWTEKLDEIKKGFENAVKVNTNMTANRTRPTTGIVGYAPCVPNALLGLPNSMIATERVAQKVKAVTIVYGPSVSGDWSTSKLIKCGVAVMQLVHKLEMQGYRVRLVCEGISSEAGGDLVQYFVTLKDWKQPLDLAKLAFPMVNPSMLRRIGFRWLETVPNMENRAYSGGYGYPKTMGNYETVVKAYKEKYKCLGANDYYLTAYMVSEEKFDIERIMKRAGMTTLVK